MQFSHWIGMLQLKTNVHYINKHGQRSPLQQKSLMFLTFFDGRFVN